MFKEQGNNPELEKEKKIKTKEILTLKSAVAELIDEMKDKIEAGKYSLIIGDESSGRIPTLLINKVISKIYEENGLEKPKIVFLAGNNPGKAAADYVEVLDDFFKEHKIEFPDKDHGALISTEYILSGTRLKPLTQMLRDRNVEYEIACANKLEDDDYNDLSLEELETILGGKIYSASIDAGSAFWRRPDMSGTSRKSLIKMEPLTKRADKDYFDSEKLKIVREDIEIASEEIFEEYKAKRNS